jgi:aminoglycoside 3-N-acetyltransferase I
MAPVYARRMTDVMRLHRLAPGDDMLFEGMLDLFGAAFEEPENYGAARPGPDYRRRLLSTPTFAALVALDGAEVVGALAGYELPKFESERSEFYIYDLAVAASHRRRGIATALIRAFGRIAAERGGWVVFVQADPGDAPAVALYDSLGTREEVLHFDIAPD